MKTANPDAELPPDVVEAIRDNRKIDAIKLLREHRNLGLKEAKEIVEDYIDGHPQPAVKRKNSAETGLGRVILVAVLIAALYGLYRLTS